MSRHRTRKSDSESIAVFEHHVLEQRKKESLAALVELNLNSESCGVDQPGRREDSNVLH